MSPSPAGMWSHALACAVAVAVGALGLSLAGELGAWSAVAVAASVVVIALAAGRCCRLERCVGARAAQRDPHARSHRGRPLRRRDLRPVPVDRRVRLLTDVGGAGSHGGGAPVGGGRRRPGAFRRPDRQRAHHAGRAPRCCSTSVMVAAADRLGAPAPGRLDRGLGAGRGGDGPDVPATDRADARLLDAAEPGIQLVRAVDLGFRRGVDRDRRDGTRLHRPRRRRMPDSRSCSRSPPRSPCSPSCPGCVSVTRTRRSRAAR